MAVDEVNAQCGLQIDGENYEVVIIVEDDESKAESAVAVATRLIVEENVVAIIGPQASKQAVPAGQVANDRETPMTQPLVNQPGHHQGSSLGLPRSLPRSFPGTSRGWLCGQRIRGQDRCCVV